MLQLALEGSEVLKVTLCRRDAAHAMPATTEKVQDPQRVTVQVRAEGATDADAMKFIMRSDATFGRMMAAWSRHHGVAPEEVSFRFAAQRLRPDDSPMEVGWRAEDGELVVQATPQEPPWLAQGAVLQGFPDDEAEALPLGLEVELARSRSDLAGREARVRELEALVAAQGA